MILQYLAKKTHPDKLFGAVWRFYTRDQRKHYDLFGKEKPPGDEDFRKAWKSEMEEDKTLWTGSEDESSDDEKGRGKNRLEEEIRKARLKAKEHSDKINADDSDELWSIWSDSDEEKTLWTGSEGDDDNDIPTEAYPNESSDKYIDKLSCFHLS